MISGKLAFGDLTLEFGHNERLFEEASREVTHLTEECARLLERERELVEELASIYLPDLSPGSVSSVLHELERQMRELLAEHETYRSRVVAELESMDQRLDDLGSAVARAEEEEAAAAGALAEVQDAIERSLVGEPGLAEAVAEHRALLTRRSILKTRRTRLISTANVERYNYERHRPFAYLLDRRFGEPEYQAGFLRGRLDRWLAQRIGYETLRRNYRILRTGPHALHAEMRRLSERAEALEAEIDARQAEVAEEHGLRPSLDAEQRAQEALVQARDRLAEATERRDALATEMRSLDADRGAPYQAALRLHADFLEDKNVKELLRIAESTPDPRDDALVERLGNIRDELSRKRAELDERSRNLDTLATKTNRLGEVVRRTAHRFSSRRSYFPEEERLREIFHATTEGDADAGEVMGWLADEHRAEPLLKPSLSDTLDGWFAEISSLFDPELGAVTVDVEGEGEEQVLVYDANGKLLHRRVTRRKLGGE